MAGAGVGPWLLPGRRMPLVSPKFTTKADRLAETIPPPMSQSKPDPLSGRIFIIRGQRVLLDADLARLYGTTTKRFNEAFKRNESRFPKDFAFQLTAPEVANLKSQFATSSLEPSDKKRTANLKSQFVTSSF